MEVQNMRSELPNGYVLRADDSTSTYKIENSYVKVI